MRKVTLFFVSVLACCASAYGQASPTCLQLDVQNTLNSALRNATVTIPSGTCTWASTVTISKGVTLTGAGAGSTIITNSGGNITMLQVSPDATSIANSDNIKISGFTFDGGGNQFSMIGVTGAGVLATKPYRYYIVTNNTFRNSGSVGGQGNNAVQVNGQARGVISHNTFDRCEFPFRSFGAGGGGDTREFTNAAYVPFTLGGSDSNYFEDNTILWSSSFTSSEGAPGWIESGQGGRLVVRFNTWNFANAIGQSEVWDVHGNQNFQGHNINGQTATMMTEYYNNTITNGAIGIYRWIDHRGSWGMFINNSFSGASNPVIQVNQYANSNQSTSGCYDQMVNPNGSTYTGPDLTIANTYFVNNTINGTVTAATFDSSVNGCGVVENGAVSAFGTGVLYGWWNQNAGFNGTVGVGRGLRSARPVTCTTGVAYWATDIANPQQSGGPLANGVLDKCISTNTWTNAYYTPYTYPNPLAGGPSQAATPTFSPVAGSYISPRIVTITSSTSGAILCYTIDGTVPTANGAGTCTHGTTLANGGTITVSFTQLLQAVASQSGFLDSSVGSAQYTFPTSSTPVTFAGKFNTDSLCPVVPATTQLCYARDCGCMWISMNGAAYWRMGVASVNGKTGNVVLGIQ